MQSLKKFNQGDKVVPEEGAEFRYPLKEYVLEVEHQLYSFETIDGEVKDTYVHVWRAKDKSAFYKFEKRSFAVSSHWFRKITDQEEADYLLDEL